MADKTTIKTNWLGVGIGAVVTLGVLYVFSYVIGSGFSSGSKN